MSWTKGQLVDAAFSQIALAAYAFDLDPDERAEVLGRLEGMLGTWEGKGIKLGYAFSDAPDEGDLDADSGLQPQANETVYCNLAIRIASMFGKVVSQDLRTIARQGYDTLLWKAAQPPQQQLPDRLPRGAGNKPWRRTDRPFMPTPDTSPLGNTDGGDLDILE
jgi:hypothetical protein